MVKLNDETIQLIRDKKSVFVKIQAALEVSEKTMYGYLNDNHPNLTKLVSLTALIEETGKPLSELVIGAKANKLMAK